MRTDPDSHPRRPLPFSRPALAALVTAMLTLASPPRSRAAETPEPTEAKPALNLRVLDAVEVKFPDHSVFYQRVAPPAVPAARVPVAVPVVPPLSLAESVAAEAREAKKSALLMLSATVYDRQVTELRWRSGNRDYYAWSNLDFNYLAGQGEIETADCIYFLMMGLGNETRESVAEWNRFAPKWERLAAAEGLADSWETKAVPDLAKFPAGRSTYLLSGEAPADDSLAALDALHRYFDTHRLRLIAEYAKREATRIAREQWNKEHPPVPQDTIINFWPKKSSNYPTGQ